MRILIACLDGELLWAIDDAISGLYSIDQRTFETKCAIDCRELFPNGRFIIQSLMKWKEDYIVLIPLEIDKSWIFYHKVSGKIEYRKVMDKKCQETLITVDQEGNQLYFFPYNIYDPIIIGDLGTSMCWQMIKDWSGKAPDGCKETAWKGIYNGQYIFFPIRNTKIFVRMDCKTRKVKLLELNISENMIGVDYAFEELWVLPMGGNRLYQIDENGRIIKIAMLSVGNTTDSLPGFARIVVQKRYLFLLPYYRKGIYVYDKQKGTTQVIPEGSSALEENREINLRYWEYYVQDNRICFLPFQDQYLEVDLDTLMYKERELDYPATWSDEEKIEKIIWSHVYEDDLVIREVNECDQGIFLKYIQYKANKEEFSSAGHAGRRIWDMLKDKRKST